MRRYGCGERGSKMVVCMGTIQVGWKNGVDVGRVDVPGPVGLWAFLANGDTNAFSHIYKDGTSSLFFCSEDSNRYYSQDLLSMISSLWQ